MFFGGAGCGTHMLGEHTATEPHPMAYLLDFQKQPLSFRLETKSLLSLSADILTTGPVSLPLSLHCFSLWQGFQNGNKWNDRKPTLVPIL